MTNERPLVDRLRAPLAHGGTSDHYRWMKEAANEIERLRAAMTGWTSYAWKDKCYVDNVQEYFDSVLKGIAPTSLAGVGYSSELLEELEKKNDK